jgi:hypothetical protein
MTDGMVRTLAIAIGMSVAGCGGGQGPAADAPAPARTPAADRGPGPAPQEHGQPADERIARAVEQVPESESPVPLRCDDPAFLGGDLVIGGERVRLPSTCYPIERAMRTTPERPARR